MALALGGILGACQTTEQDWELVQRVPLGDIHPTGLAVVGEQLWVADGDHQRVAVLTLQGERLRTYDSLDRPMHLAADSSRVIVPEYGADRITVLVPETGERRSLSVPDSLDAPAGVSVLGSAMAIADFYHHRVRYYDGARWQSWGTEGHAPGEFYYPTDVQLTDDALYVADAYNHRVQVLDRQGGAPRLIGEDQSINGAVGLFVDDQEVYVTDYENHRVWVFAPDGGVRQRIDDLSHPTDVVVHRGRLYVVSYGDQSLRVYRR